MSDHFITSLIEKLEGAETGSRELDREIMALSYDYEQRHIGASCWDDDDDTCCPGAKHLDWVWVDPATGQWKTNARDGFEFTTSLDAALALTERLKLSVGEILNDALEGPAGVGIWQSGWNGTISTIPQIARFVCIAILRAQSEARATGEDSPANEGEGAQ